MTWGVLASFVALCVLLELTPGPDSFLVLRYSLSQTRAGIAAAAGSAVGSLVWASAVGFGLATLLQGSTTAYRLLKVAGGLYLLYLGVSALVQRRKSNSDNSGRSARTQPLVALRSGFLSCVLNPKVGLFFLAVVPQFLPTDRVAFAAAMIFGAINAVVAFMVLALLACVAGRAVRWLRRPRVTRTVDRISAAVLAVFGVGTLTGATVN